MHKHVEEGNEKRKKEGRKKKKEKGKVVGGGRGWLIRVATTVVCDDVGWRGIGTCYHREQGVVACTCVVGGWMGEQGVGKTK